MITCTITIVIISLSLSLYIYIFLDHEETIEASPAIPTPSIKKPPQIAVIVRRPRQTQVPPSSTPQTCAVGIPPMEQINVTPKHRNV